MKKLKISVFVLLCSIAALSSCKKEEIVEPISSPKKVKKSEFANKDGGGDDDDIIIIYGVTQNVSSSPIQGVSVVVFESNTSLPIDTTESDSQGEFQFSLETGVYYFEATALGYQDLQTGEYTFTTNDNVELTMVE